MKNLKAQLLSYLKKNNSLDPNSYQLGVVSAIEDTLIKFTTFDLLKLRKKFKYGVYIHGSVGVGKSILLKALGAVYPNSMILHFNDLIFNLQSKSKEGVDFLANAKKKKLIIVDEFFINNLTSIILFDKFLQDIKKANVPLVMSGNKKLSEIYDDPVNPNLCKKIRKELETFFLSVLIKSKVDYRVKNKISENFFFLNNSDINSKQNLIIKNLSLFPQSNEMKFQRKGNSFVLNKTYGNLIDLEFKEFFSKNFVFQDYEIIAKKIKVFIIRNVRQMDENSKNLLTRFISFIDVVYENKNILSISSNVELDELYVGKTNAYEFKRTLSRLKEIGSNKYIDINLNK